MHALVQIYTYKCMYAYEMVQMFLIKGQKEQTYVSLPICHPAYSIYWLLQHRQPRSFSLSIPLLAPVIVNADEKEEHKPQHNFNSVSLQLSRLEATHCLPDARRPA